MNQSKDHVLAHGLFLSMILNNKTKRIINLDKTRIINLEKPISIIYQKADLSFESQTTIDGL